MPPQTEYVQETAIGHVWRVRDANTGALIREVLVDSQSITIPVNDVNRVYLPLIVAPIRGGGPTVPPYLLQGWLVQTETDAVRTYDFTDVEAAGLRTVRMTKWRHMGSLGWQPQGGFPAVYTVTNERIFLQTATGYREEWFITEVQTQSMLVRGAAGHTERWFNCSAPGWPIVIQLATPGCRRL